MNNDWTKKAVSVLSIIEEMDTVEIDGRKFYLDSVVNLMDNDIREEVHADLAPCRDQEFVDEYRRRHLDTYGEEFIIN